MGEQRSRLIFIDETGTTTKMTRLRGRSVRGQRLNSKAPFGHWGTQTFVAGLKCDGLVAPFVIDAPMNRAIFETWVETQLIAVLKPGDNRCILQTAITGYPTPTTLGGAGPSLALRECPQDNNVCIYLTPYTYIYDLGVKQVFPHN